jgi:L-alanine-DL-glutamate epimerase-like enolase superfamily enzyme
MGSPAYMQEQLQDKLAQGYHCIKLKIGAIDFEQELGLLRVIRQQFSKEQVELRVDANGAFAPKEAMYKLDKLAEFDIHSIEQPIKQGQWQAMADLCRNTPIPIALDEELIGIDGKDRKRELLSAIKPQYIILKPSLIGGITSSEEWAIIAKDLGIGWWATSALESNIGLNAIAQWVFTQKNPMPQGLGTGQLYTNNIDCPLYLNGDKQYYLPNGKWVLDFV